MEIQFPEKKTKPKKATKANFNMKSGKFFLNVQKGMSKQEAAIEAGAHPHAASELEKTENYSLCEKAYADVLIGKISLSEIADLNIRNMKQGKDVGGSNTAIKMALDKIEPDNAPQSVNVVKVVFEGEEDAESRRVLPADSGGDSVGEENKTD